MNGTDFGALFDGFTRTVFRFEARPFYSVGGDEAERIAAFREGRPRPERSVRTSPWLARIATSTVLDGKSWSRVRIVDDPLTEYQRYQLVSYQESQAVGEHIRIVARSAATEDVGADFWLFDGDGPDAFGVRMHYGDGGAIREREFVPAGPGLAAMQDNARDLAGMAIELNSFLVSSAVADA